MKSAQVVERRSIDYIPRNERHGKVWHQGPFWFTSNFVLLTMAAGFSGPLMGLGFGWSAIAIVLGAVIGTFFMAFHANQGPTLGIPQLIQSRAQFGSRGVILILLAGLFVYMGINVFDVVTATDAFQSVVGEDSPRWAWYVGIVIVQLVIAVFGYNMIHRVQRWLTYALILFFGIVTVAAVIVLGGPSIFTMGEFMATPFFAQLAALAGYFVAYGIYVSDYTRYMPADTKPGPIITWTYVGAVGSAAWLTVLGALLASVLKDEVSVGSLVPIGNEVFPGFGSLVMILSGIALVTVMAVNTYGATLVTMTAVDGIKPFKPSMRIRIGVSVVLSLIALLLAFPVGATDFVNSFDTLLTLFLYFLVPWSAVNLVDYYFVRHGRFAVTEIFKIDGVYGKWGWRGLTAYAVGFLTMIPFISLSFFEGPLFGLLQFDLSWLVGLIVSGVVYLILARTINRDREEAAYAESEAELLKIEAEGEVIKTQW